MIEWEIDHGATRLVSQWGSMGGIRTLWVRILNDFKFDISGHGAGSLVSQWGSTKVKMKVHCHNLGAHPDMTLDVART